MYCKSISVQNRAIKVFLGLKKETRANTKTACIVFHNDGTPSTRGFDKRRLFFGGGQERNFYSRVN